MDRRYLAGVIDSDGSISITKRNTKRKRPSYAVLVQLTWKYNGLTEKYFKDLVECYGGSYFKSNRSVNRFPNAKPTIKYCASGKAAKALIEDIRPYIILKEKQCINAIKSLTINKFCRRYGGRKPKPDVIQTFQENLYNINKELNSGS